MPTLLTPLADLYRFQAVMQTLHRLGYYAPEMPWGSTIEEGFRLIPADYRARYAFSTEADFRRAFASPPSGDPPGGNANLFMSHPLHIHWNGEGTTVARTFYEAGFFVRWPGNAHPTIQVRLSPFEHPHCPLWAPDAWSHLMSILRLLETQGYTAPQTPTICLDRDILPPPRITFGHLEQDVARFGSLHPVAATVPLKTPLFLTWTGTLSEGIHIATTFHREGCQVWWRGAPEALMAVAPTTCNFNVNSPHFPRWLPALS